MEFVFGLGAHYGQSLPLSATRVVNAYFERQHKNAKSQTPLFGSPGLTQFCNLPFFPVRGMWPAFGSLYAVAGETLFRINSGGSFKQIGSGIANFGQIAMRSNENQLMAVNGSGGWIVDYSHGGEAFSQIQDPNFQSAATVSFFDGYFCFDRRGTNQFFLSNVNNGLPPYNGLLFATAEAKPGFVLATEENLQLQFIFSDDHIEMWYDAGTAPFPWQRYAGGVIEFGCGAGNSVIKQDGAIFFLGSDLIFYRLQGNVPIRASNHDVETVWSTYPITTDAFGFTYTFRGHKMVHLTFPSQPASWVFDVSTNEWHERESMDAVGNLLGRWRGNCCAEAFGKILIGDYQSGQIGYLDPNNYTEYGNPMPFIAYSNPIHADKRRVFIGRLELDMETGVAPPTGQGSAPQNVLQWSKDGAKTWSTIAPVRSLGATGQNRQRLRYINLGQSYQWVFRILITDPVKRALIATHIDARPGMA
jgi:hypothetical protein